MNVRAPITCFYWERHPVFGRIKLCKWAGYWYGLHDKDSPLKNLSSFHSVSFQRHPRALYEGCRAHLSWVWCLLLFIVHKSPKSPWMWDTLDSLVRCLAKREVSRPCIFIALQTKCGMRLMGRCHERKGNLACFGRRAWHTRYLEKKNRRVFERCVLPNQRRCYQAMRAARRRFCQRDSLSPARGLRGYQDEGETRAVVSFHSLLLEYRRATITHHPGSHVWSQNQQLQNDNFMQGIGIPSGYSPMSMLPANDNLDRSYSRVNEPCFWILRGAARVLKSSRRTVG